MSLRRLSAVRARALTVLAPVLVALSGLMLAACSGSGSAPAARLPGVAALTNVPGVGALASVADKVLARCEDGAAEVVCTRQGAVRGVVEDGLIAFKGIPYAAAPVDALRWQPPRPPAVWTGVRDGSRYGAICPQLVNGEFAGDEDCLTVNVWTTPQALKTAERRPVMVFFQGGGNHGFSGQGAPVFGGVRYSGGALVPQGVVLVTFNWRLGALGWLTHPALDAERPERVSGNYGLMDQIALLRWVRENISAFGGDPRKVFAFGTSAGGGDLCTLLATPSARGLLHGVALQASVPTGCELPTMQQAQAATGQRVVEALGCAMGRPAETAACLRGRPMTDLVRAVPGTFGVQPRLYGPVVDGSLVPEQPIAAIRADRHAAMPALVGNSARETQQFVDSFGPVPDAAAYAAAVQRHFGARDARRILAAYPLTPRSSPRETLVRLTTDAYFTCSSRRVARTLAAHQSQPVYRFLFDHALDNDAALRALGPVHTLEHVFLFPFSGKYSPSEAERALQRLMVGHWTSMARTGRPQPGWPATGPGDRVLRIGPGPKAAEAPVDAAARCDLWDTVTLPQPHL